MKERYERSDMEEEAARMLRYCELDPEACPYGAKVEEDQEHRITLGNEQAENSIMLVRELNALQEKINEYFSAEDSITDAVFHHMDSGPCRRRFEAARAALRSVSKEVPRA